MLSNSTLILILAIISIVTGIISMVVAFIIVNSPSYDRLSPAGPKPYGPLILAFVFTVGGLVLLTSSIDKKTDVAYNRYVRKAAPDSGYSVYYNGQAVSGSALGIDKENFDGFDIKYDEKNKIIKIMQKR